MEKRTKEIGLNLDITSGKNGVRLIPIYDATKSAIATKIKIPPDTCIKVFIKIILKKLVSNSSQMF